GDVGIQQADPSPLAQTPAFVDRPGEAAVGPAAPPRDAAPTPQPARQFMAWGMVVDDHDLCRPAPHTRSFQELPNQPARLFPQAIVHDYDRDTRNPDCSLVLAKAAPKRRLGG